MHNEHTKALKFWWENIICRPHFCMIEEHANQLLKSQFKYKTYFCARFFFTLSIKTCYVALPNNSIMLISGADITYSYMYIKSDTKKIGIVQIFTSFETFQVPSSKYDYYDFCFACMRYFLRFKPKKVQKKVRMYNFGKSHCFYVACD